MEENNKQLHPIEKLCEEYGMTRYAFCKKANVTESTISSLVVRNTPIRNIKIGIIIEMSEIFGVTKEEVIDKLLAYEN